MAGISGLCISYSIFCGNHTSLSFSFSVCHCDVGNADKAEDADLGFTDGTKASEEQDRAPFSCLCCDEADNEVEKKDERKVKITSI